MRYDFAVARYYIKGGFGNYADVSAISDVGDEFDEYPYGTVGVEGSKELPNFGPSYNVETGDRDGPLRPSIHYEMNTGKNSEQDPPTELFTHVPPQIRYAFVDPRMRHTVPTMVAIGMKHLGVAHEVPMADKSLTKFSSALSRNAADRGLVVPNALNPRMENTNEIMDDETSPPEMTRWDKDYYESDLYGNYDRVPASEVAQARTWVRNRIRGDQKPKKQIKRGDSQFEQLNLGL